MNRWVIFVALVFLTGTAAPVARAGSAVGAVEWVDDDACGGESCGAVIRGLFGFAERHPRGLNGNGRSCADCHMPLDNFQLSPANAEARFKLLEARRRWNRHADDPLFRALDADDFRIHGEHANDFGNLRENGLIRITFTLPPNVKVIDPATNAVSNQTTVDVWRAVPSVLNVRLTGPDGANPWGRGPNLSGGYQLDARLGTLQEQAAAALTNHAQITGAAPARLLDDLTAFQNRLFSSPRARVLSDAIRTGAATLPDADPPLDVLQAQGKVIFARACGQCHGGAGMSTPQLPVVRYHDISSQCPRPVDTAAVPRWSFTPCPARLARNVATYEITQPDGSILRRTTSDPGRTLLTGFAGGLPARDDWSHFDVPGLRGISKTAPYFINNSAATLEEVVTHYTEFFKRVQALAPPAIPLPPAISTDGVHADRPYTAAEVPALLAYLRKL
jgi:cytochrome c peroxidase